ncbi:unnamed protein product [Cylicocyclus nassatus]|uniref:Lysozyme n=1 Tax=Cylicocyclus nassatus TaxID=53992 RepID=A0AA36MGF0_CYLNA|nr:unnamed protein product [Cylicocyclus nassatus]
MRILLIICVLVASWQLVASKPAGPELNLTANYAYAYALDIDKPVSYDGFNCIKQYRYSAVFIRGYDPAGQGRFDVNAVNNIHCASQVGLGTEVFMTPQKNSIKRGADQFMEIYTGLLHGNIQMKTLWVQVTSPIHWDQNIESNIAFLNEIIITANKYGVIVGFYTNAYDWSQITSNANLEGAMLWYWNVYGGGVSGETPANFDDFHPFARFLQPVAKQFGQQENVCGIIVNRDVYSLNGLKYSAVPVSEKANDRVVVGTLLEGSHIRNGLLKSN